MWLLTRCPLLRKTSAQPRPPALHLSVQLICAYPGTNLHIGSLVLQSPGFHLLPCHHLARLCGSGGWGSRDQQSAGLLQERSCWALTCRRPGRPCHVHKHTGQWGRSKERVQEPLNKDLSLMAVHCPQWKPSVMWLPSAAGCTSCLLRDLFFLLPAPGALDGCLFKAISS